jgi:hypothetical protein
MRFSKKEKERMSPKDREYVEKIEAQEAERDKVRRVWGVTKPNRKLLPGWLTDPGYEDVLQCPIFDHYGGIGDKLVAEPYFNEHNEHFIELAKEHAKKFGLKFRWSMESWHFPGRTIRFEFWQ